jgi:hypothetical protein
MLKCYQIDLTEEQANQLKDSDYSMDVTSKLLYKIKKSPVDEIKKFMLKDEKNILDHSSFVKNWFPKTGCHIFLSHSHGDIEIVTLIANVLYSKYGIKSFIDSYFWKNVNSAIIEIDEKHNKIRTDLYDYKGSMQTCSNFYMILSNALSESIHESDSFFFICTNYNKGSSDQYRKKTFSPWIYSELKISSLLKPSPHKDRPYAFIDSFIRKTNKASATATIDESFRVQYELPNYHLTKVDIENFFDAIDNTDENEEHYNTSAIFSSLDKLYRNLG